MNISRTLDGSRGLTGKLGAISTRMRPTSFVIRRRWSSRLVLDGVGLQSCGAGWSGRVLDHEWACLGVVSRERLAASRWFGAQLRASSSGEPTDSLSGGCCALRACLAACCLASVCCRRQLQMSRWLLQQKKDGVWRDSSSVDHCRDRLESEAVKLRYALSRSERQVAHLQVLCSFGLFVFAVFCRARVASLESELAAVRKKDAPAAVPDSPLAANPFAELCSPRTASGGVALEPEALLCGFVFCSVPPRLACFRVCPGAC